MGEYMKSTKTELVKTILNNKLNKKDKKDLEEMLIKEHISINENITIGDKIADKVSAIVGSWTFIIVFVLVLIGWMVLNTVIFKSGKEIDPYPFILLNLILSCIAAIQAPIIMMSQNRQAKKDTKRHQNDYKIDLKSELLLEEVHKKMDIILKQQKQLLKNEKQ